MKLFNKYKNKDFTYMINYINNYINNPDVALTPDTLKSELLGDSQNTFIEFIEALLNINTNGLDAHQPNANLLYEHNGIMAPLREVSIPIRPTYCEKAWLYYVLSTPKADLFIDSDLKDALLEQLSQDLDFPLSDDYVDIRNLSPVNTLMPTKEIIHSFRLIIQAIQTQRYLQLTNTGFDGQIYANQKLIPYKLEYTHQVDSFSLSAFPLDAKRPVKMNLANLSNVTLLEKVTNYDQFIQDFEQMLLQTREPEPIQLEIRNQNEAYDRCSFKFSPYDKVSYINDSGNLIMQIYYYRFQKDEIIRNILFLGPYVKVISPQPIVDEIVNILQALI